MDKQVDKMVAAICYSADNLAFASDDGGVELAEAQRRALSQAVANVALVLVACKEVA